MASAVSENDGAAPQLTAEEEAELLELFDDTTVGLGSAVNDVVGREFDDNLWAFRVRDVVEMHVGPPTGSAQEGDTQPAMEFSAGGGGKGDVIADFIEAMKERSAEEDRLIAEDMDAMREIKEYELPKLEPVASTVDDDTDSEDEARRREELLRVINYDSEPDDPVIDDDGFEALLAKPVAVEDVLPPEAIERVAALGRELARADERLAAVKSEKNDRAFGYVHQVVHSAVGVDAAQEEPVPFPMLDASPSGGTVPAEDADVGSFEKLRRLVVRSYRDRMGQRQSVAETKLGVVNSGATTANQAATEACAPVSTPSVIEMTSLVSELEGRDEVQERIAAEVVLAQLADIEAQAQRAARQVEKYQQLVEYDFDPHVVAAAQGREVDGGGHQLSVVAAPSGARNPVSSTLTVQETVKQERRAAFMERREKKERRMMRDEDVRAQIIINEQIEQTEETERRKSKMLSSESLQRNHIMSNEAGWFAKLMANEGKQRQVLLEFIAHQAAKKVAEVQQQLSMLLDSEEPLRASVIDQQTDAWSDIVQLFGESGKEIETVLEARRVAEEERQAEALNAELKEFAQRCNENVEASVKKQPSNDVNRKGDEHRLALFGSRLDALRRKLELRSEWATSADFSTVMRSVARARRDSVSSTPNATTPTATSKPVANNADSSRTGSGEPTDNDAPAILNDALVERFYAFVDLGRLRKLNVTVEDLETAYPLRKTPAVVLCNISGNKFASLPADFLSALPRLKQLNMSDNRVDTLRWLVGAPTSLVWLDLSVNKLTSLSDGLVDRLNNPVLPGLKVLSAVANSIADVAALQHYESVMRLDLYRNNISELEPLGGLSLLTSLNVGRNSIATINLRRNLLLQELVMYNNRITELPHRMPNALLRELFLNDNKITAVPEVSYLPLLTSLHLSSNQIKSLHGLGSCVMLSTLHLAFNCIPSVEELKHMAPCKRLEVLSVNDNPVTSTEKSTAEAHQFLICALPLLRDLDNEVVTQKQRRAAEGSLAAAAVWPRIVKLLRRPMGNGRYFPVRSLLRFVRDPETRELVVGAGGAMKWGTALRAANIEQLEEEGNYDKDVVSQLYAHDTFCQRQIQQQEVLGMAHRQRARQAAQLEEQQLADEREDRLEDLASDSALMLNPEVEALLEAAGQVAGADGFLEQDNPDIPDQIAEAAKATKEIERRQQQLEQRQHTRGRRSEKYQYFPTSCEVVEKGLLENATLLQTHLTEQRECGIGKDSLHLFNVHVRSQQYTARKQKYLENAARGVLTKWLNDVVACRRARVVLSALRAEWEQSEEARFQRYTAAARRIQPLWRGAWTRMRLKRNEWVDTVDDTEAERWANFRFDQSRMGELEPETLDDLLKSHAKATPHPPALFNVPKGPFSPVRPSSLPSKPTALSPLPNVRLDGNKGMAGGAFMPSLGNHPSSFSGGTGAGRSTFDGAQNRPSSLGGNNTARHSRNDGGDILFTDTTASADASRRRSDVSNAKVDDEWGDVASLIRKRDAKRNKERSKAMQPNRAQGGSSHTKQMEDIRKTMGVDPTVVSFKKTKR